MFPVVLAISANAEVSDNQDKLRRVKVSVENAYKIAHKFETEGYGLLHGSITNTSFEIISTSEEVNRLKSDGYLITVLEVGHPLLEEAGTEAAPTGYQNLAAINILLLRHTQI